MTVHGRKGLDKALPDRHAEHTDKPQKKAKSPHQKPDTGYVPSPKSHTNIGIGQMRPHPMPSITTGSSEAYLMQRALGRLDKAIGAYETQVKSLETDPTIYQADRGRLNPLIQSFREVQGQLDSCSHHAEDLFKDRPVEYKNAQDTLQKYNARFETLTNRVNKADPSLNFPLHPTVPRRY